jgi:hypothetical protein
MPQPPLVVQIAAWYVSEFLDLVAHRAIAGCLMTRGQSING